jgi:hypothetical protein
MSVELDPAPAGVGERKTEVVKADQVESLEAMIFGRYSSDGKWAFVKLGQEGPREFVPFASKLAFEASSKPDSSFAPLGLSKQELRVRSKYSCGNIDTKNANVNMLRTLFSKHFASMAEDGSGQSIEDVISLPQGGFAFNQTFNSGRFIAVEELFKRFAAGQAEAEPEQTE